MHKILLKILANRLKVVLLDVISLLQGAFIVLRQVLD